MGKIKHLTKIRELLAKTPVVHISSIRRIIGERSTYVYLLLNKMVKKVELFRLTKGWYSSQDDPTLTVFCFRPAYLGLQEALSIHNLWDQETNTMILTTQTVREGRRSIFGKNVIVKRLPKSLFFGIEYKRYCYTYVPVSDIEKTFLDLVYFNQPIDSETMKRIKKKYSYKKMHEYLRYYNKKIKQRVKNIMRI